MSWRNVRLIFMREMRDQLRDRRTLFMIAILPLLLYPALGIGMLQMGTIFTVQERTVVVLGADHLPKPALLRKDRFVGRWIPTDVDKLRVFSDRVLAEGETQLPVARKLLAQAREIRKRLTTLDQLATAKKEAKQNQQSGEIERIEQDFKSVKAEISELFAAGGMQVLIVVPDGFADDIAEMNRWIAERQDGTERPADYPRPMIVRNSADEKSMIAFSRVQGAMDAWEKEILKQRLDQAQLPETTSRPVKGRSVDLAREEQFSASLWSKIFPALLVIMAVTGAFYPAVDVAAGEKERGTMETLLICPASRTEIVMGKFFTVMVFSISTALLNLVSMGFTGKQMAMSAASGPMSNLGDLSLPPLSALLWVMILLIPLAALLSALCLALATFARSSKEGQYYLTPLLMVTMGLTVFCLSPAVEITPFYSVMPIVGIALLMKAMLLAPVQAGSLYFYVIPVLLTSIGYSVLALWWAIDQFKSESVLFREAERFEIGLWIRHLMRDKEPTPSFTEAGFCFVMIMLLQFVAMNVMRTLIVTPDGIVSGRVLMKTLMIQQLAIILTPALAMGVVLTTSVVRTFRLRLPDWKMLAVAAILPVALHPLSLELAVSMSWFFPQLPAGVQKILATMSSADEPLWLVLLAFAAAPAFCEEVAFRGFILSGFNRTGRIWLAIGLSSLTFGIMHMIPQQVFNAALVGLVLGLIAVRSNSLLPCIVFHFIYNSIAVLHGRIGDSLDPAAVKSGPAKWFISMKEGAVRYEWLTLAPAAAVGMALIWWLVNYTTEEADSSLEPTIKPVDPEPASDLTLGPGGAES